jgi:purine nucleosidase
MLGPLTNLALALQRRPELPQLVREVLVMGGAFTRSGNVTHYAEANLYNDPDATAAVLARCEWRVTMLPIDITEEVRVPLEWFERVAREAGNRAGRFGAEIARWHASVCLCVFLPLRPPRDTSRTSMSA